MRYVIVGGGIAGTTAAEELRKRDPRAEIVLVSEEQHPVYSRVLLPHYLKGKISRERVFLKKESWYEAERIEWVRGLRAVHLDPRNKTIGLSDGRELPYDKLLIASGGELRTLSSDIRGVSYLRTLDDADHLMQLLNERNGFSRGAVYGGGFIACEYINLFAHFGLPICVAFRGSYFWSRLLDPAAGALIMQCLVAHGVELHPNAIFSDIIGEKELTGFLTSSGTHACSILGVGIGVEPDLSWISEAGVEVRCGIVCNEFLQTNVPNVYAAGDVAEFYDVIVGRHVREGNWMNATMQGRHVAHVMMGEMKPFELVSSYATNVLGLEIIFVGDISKEHADDVRVFGSVEDGGVAQLFARSGQLIGGILVGRNQDRSPVTNLIRRRGKLTQFKKD